MSEDKLDKKTTTAHWYLIAYFIARLRRGRTSIYNNLVLYGSDGNPMGVNYGKFWLDAEHTVAGLKLL